MMNIKPLVLQPLFMDFYLSFFSKVGENVQRIFSRFFAAQTGSQYIFTFFFQMLNIGIRALKSDRVEDYVQF